MYKTYLLKVSCIVELLLGGAGGGGGGGGVHEHGLEVGEQLQGLRLLDQVRGLRQPGPSQQLPQREPGHGGRAGEARHGRSRAGRGRLLEVCEGLLEGGRRGGGVARNFS